MIPSKALAAVTPNELSRSATLFTIIKQLRLKVTSISNQNNDINSSTNLINEEVLDEAFETHVQSVLEKLDNRLPNITEDIIKQAEIVMAKHGLYDAAFQQAILLCLAIFPALGNSLKDIRGIHSGFISDLYQIIESSNKDNIYLSNELHTTKQQLTNIDNDNRKLLEAVKSLDKEAEDQKHLILDLRQQIRELSTKLSVYENVTTPTTPNAKGSDPLPQAFNKPLTTASRNSTPLRSSKKDKPIEKSTNKLSETRSTIRSSNNQSIYQSKNPYIKTFEWLSNYRFDIQSRIDSKQYRYLTMNECLDSIDKIYESKLLANEKAKETEPMETLEQHLYQMYEKKYGLRQLALENIARFLYSCSYYSKENNAIDVFTKIFHNEIEEDYLLVQKELIKSIYDLLMLQIMKRNPTKDHPTLQNLLSDKTSTYVSIEEYTDILTYLYDPIDSQIVISQVNEAAIQEMTLSQELNDKMELEKSPLTKLITNQKKLNDLSIYVSNQEDRIDTTKDIDAPIIVKNISGTKYNPPTTSTGSPHPPANIFDSKRLGYNSPTIGLLTTNKSNYIPIETPKPITTDPIPVKLSNSQQNSQQSTTKNNPINNKIFKRKLVINFSNFLKIVLNYQLNSHIQYLSSFHHIFNKYDDNHDGIVSIEQFYQIYIEIRKYSSNSNNKLNDNINIIDNNESLDIFSMLVKLIDPLEYDIITYSSAIHVLNKIGLKLK